MDAHNQCQLSEDMLSKSNRGKEYHVFFLCHLLDQRWAWVARTRLEACHEAIRCYCSTECQNSSETETLSLKWIFSKMNASLFTVIVISPHFLNDIWCPAHRGQSEPEERKHGEAILNPQSVICLNVDNMLVPSEFKDFTIIDVSPTKWWTELLSWLASRDGNEAEITRSNGHVMSTNNTVYKNGYLICSLKSKHGSCGREQVDLSSMPKQLKRLKLQIGRQEYQGLMSYLMSAASFRYRFWCYNLPLTIFTFGSLLALLLTIIPLVEARVYRMKQNGLEFVHAIIIWLTLFIIYITVSYLIKRKMKKGSNKRLALVNSHLSKYNILAGIEYLGIQQCNKFIIHLYYYNLAPCHEYMQELFASVDDSRVCHNQPIVDTDGHIELEGDTITSNLNDSDIVINSFTSTNVSMQIDAEDILLEHSGAYLNQLSTNKLSHTNSPRHMDDMVCLCQYVEPIVCRAVNS